jgi:hypothetical protein
MAVSRFSTLLPPHFVISGFGGLAACTDSDASPGSPNSAEASPSQSATVFQEHKITDPGMNNIVATTVLVPEGWEVEGGMTRPAPQFFNMPVMLDIKFTAPDGRRVRQFPGFRFEFNHQNPQQLLSPTMSGNMYMPLYQSAGAWLMDLIRRYPDKKMSDVRLISEEMVPDVTKQLRQNNAQLFQLAAQSRSMGAQSGIYSDFDAQVTKVVLQYQEGGKRMEETVLIAWQALVHSVYGQVASGSWQINLMYSVRGPVGTDYLNDPQMMAILHSARPNPVWLEEMNKHWMEMARIRNQGAHQRQQQANAAHRKRMQTLNETSDIIANGWKTRSQSRDAGHDRYIDSIHEVTPYQAPNGETVKLPSFYDQVYTDNNGRYLLNNDANYKPNSDPSVNQHDWQRIEQRR